MKHLCASARYVYPILLIILCTVVSAAFFSGKVSAQTFPNPATLSTGQGALGATDPIWQVSEFWYAAAPPNPMGLNYTSALINYNCAPGAWVDASSLPPPVNNGNWITGPDADCATNTNAGYRYFRLTLNLPPDCNGFSVTVPGSYVLSFDGYVDNQISEVYINGTPQGISGGSFSAGSQLSFTLSGPWVVGTNYVDILVYNVPNGGGSNPYGLLLVANAASPTDTDNDGVPNIDDLCPCTPGNNSVGCTDPPNYNNCDIAAIRQAFTAAGCEEMYSCVGDCSMYFLNPQSMSGSQAQAFAQTLGANLVSVQNAAENQCIISSLNDMGQTGVIWIGFNDEAAEGTFVWYDQAPVVYTNWAAGEPNNTGGDEDCTQIYPDGMWNDLPCGLANAKSVIEVNLCPVINAGPDVGICIGDTAQLNASNTLFGSSPYTYAWNNGPTVQSNPVSPAVDTDYSVTTVDRYNCTTSDTVRVIVNPLPTVDAGPSVVVCPQTMVTLSGSGASTYTWNNGITNGVAFMPGAAHTLYTVTGTDVNGCQNTDTVSVSVELDGCPGFPNTYICDIDSIRQAFAAAGCLEMVGCVNECSMYFLNPQSMSGSQAQAFAQTLGTNLVSVQSAAENQCIISTLNSMGQGGVIWIGFNDEAVEGNFVWYDQAPVVYTNWAAGEPNNAGGNEACTQIYADGTWNDLSCASANAKSVIEVNLCPVVNAGLDVGVCIGDTAQLSVSTLFGSSPYAYTWSNGPTGPNNPVSPATTSDYSVVSVDRYNCTASDTVKVTVNPLPPVNAGLDWVLCPGDQATVSGMGAATYVWSNGVVDGVPFTPISAFTVLTVTGTDIYGCQNTDSLTVTVEVDLCVDNPGNCDKDAIRQAFTAAGCIEMISCVSECSMYFLNQQSMSGSQAQAFAQTLGANLVSIQDQAENDCLIGSLTNLGLNTINDVIWIGLNDEAVEGTFVWYDQAPVTYTNWSNIPNPQPDNWTGADPNGENCVQIYPDGGWNDLSCASANAKSVIEVNLCPVVNAGLDVSICVGDTAQLAASNALFGSSPYTYTWSNGPVGQNNPVSPAATSDYSIFVQDRYDCEAKDTVTVTVNPLPAVNGGPDVTVCTQVPVTLSGSGATTYTWNNGVTDGVAFVPPGTTTYVVTGTDANNCQNTDTVKVTVNPKPVVNAGNDLLICAGDMVTLTGSGAATYTWDNGAVNAVPFALSTTTTYTVVGTSGQGCNDTDQVTITVTPIPVPAFTANTTLGCSPLFVTFTGVNVPGTTCQWNFGNGLTSNNCGVVNTVYIPEGCADVTLTLTTANGCPGQTVMNDMICVAPNPIADFVPTPSQLNQTNSSTTLVNTSSGATTYSWNFGDGSPGSNAISPVHVFPVSQSGTYEVMLIAASNLGCTDTAFTTIEVDASVLYYIPNAFTPGVDPLNAEFKPVFSADFDVTDYSFMIFNRWGEVIFKSLQPDSGWDGTRGQSDKLVEGGTYVWRLEFSHPSLTETKAILGRVTLVR